MPGKSSISFSYALLHRLTILLLFVVMVTACAPGVMEDYPPMAEPEQEEPEAEEPVVLPTLTVQPEGDDYEMEKRMMVVETPRRLRVGDGEIIRVSLEMNEDGSLTPTAEMDGHEVELQPMNIPNLYDDYNLVAEARLDLAGMEVEPYGVIQTPMRPGQRLDFFWSVRAAEAGIYRGTLWLYLNLEPKSGGESDQQALLARPLELKVVSFLGMPAWVGRVLGGVSGVAGLVLGIPFADLRKVFRGKRHAQTEKVGKQIG